MTICKHMTNTVFTEQQQDRERAERERAERERAQAALNAQPARQPATQLALATQPGVNGHPALETQPVLGAVASQETAEPDGHDMDTDMDEPEMYSDDWQSVDNLKTTVSKPHREGLVEEWEPDFDTAPGACCTGLRNSI